MAARCTFPEHATRSVKKEPAPQHFVRAANMLAAAGQAGRIKILLALDDGPAFVSDLAKRLELRPAHASQQLGVLRDARLVRARRRGQHVEYALADEHVRTFLGYVMALAQARR